MRLFLTNTSEWWKENELASKRPIQLGRGKPKDIFRWCGCWLLKKQQLLATATWNGPTTHHRLVRELKLVLRKNLYIQRKRDTWHGESERENETVRPIGSLEKMDLRRVWKWWAIRLRFDTVNARFVGDRCAEEREREDDVLLCFACSRFSRVCVSSHRRERERTVSSETWIKDERGDERKHPEESVCCGKALNLLGMRTALALDCEDRWVEPEARLEHAKASTV